MSNLWRWSKWVLVGLIAILFGVDGDALALPRDGAPARPVLRDASDGPVLVAARRRRYRRPRPKPRPKQKAAPKEETPEPEPAAAPAKAGGGGGGPAAGPENLQRGGRVEFDGRLVQGQTAKSGAIYLFARQRTDLRSMVRERVEYRKEILRTVNTTWGESQ
jgi:hypothetical protein